MAADELNDRGPNPYSPKNSLIHAVGYPSRERLQVKPDSLGQGKIPGIVDRVGRPAHVRLPTVGARFASAAGCLLAAECSTDFRATGSDVDVDDPAVGASGRAESFRLTH